MDVQQSEAENHILTLLQQQIRTNQLVLPSLPDVFLQVKQTVEDPAADMGKIARIITRDPSLTARILKVANNALYRSDREITNLQQAISRMGLQLIRTLVTSHAITQMFNQPKGIFKSFFLQLQQHSLEVSAHAYAIAKKYTRINPDDALLAGLVHNIGYLPVAKCIETLPMGNKTPEQLVEIMAKIHPQVGKMVLQSWGFPQQVINAAEQYVDQFRQGNSNVDLTDIVIIAGLNTFRGSDHPCTLPDWSCYPAFRKIGIRQREDINKLDEINAEINNARIMLGLQ